MTIEELQVEWEAVWLESLRTQVYELLLRRRLHDDFMAMLDSQDHPDTKIFQDAYHRMYIESQVMAVRRQSDADSRTLSLRRLIGQLEHHRRDFTRSWYVARWLGARDPESNDEGDRREAHLHIELSNSAFDQFTDAPGDSLLGGRRLQRDREALSAATERLVRYANGTVAHAERDPSDVDVTYDDFRAALDHLGDMLKRYYLLINQGALISAEPVIQGDWKGPFRRALV